MSQISAVPGSSNDLESFEYRGRRALSEPESRALASVMTDNSSFIKLYISLHCYGNFLLFPWGFTKELTVDCQDLVYTSTIDDMSLRKNVSV